MKKRDVSILLLINNDKILLQKRAKNAIRFPGKWGLFGGGLEDGEDAEVALKREINEELTLSITNCDLFSKTNYKYPELAEHGTIFCYISNYNNEKLELNEGEEMRWVEKSEVLKYDLYPDYKEIIKKYINLS